MSGIRNPDAEHLEADIVVIGAGGAGLPAAAAAVEAGAENVILLGKRRNPGGIKINQFMEITNKRYTPISGLCAAGDNAGS